MSSRKPEYDVIIVGGGMVGASLACALGNQDLRIALVEAHDVKLDTPASYDDRAIALSFGTSQIFRTLGFWQKLESSITPIKHIHVSDKGHIGVTRINYQEENVDALGYVITARELGHALYQVLSGFQNIEFISPAHLEKIEFTDDRVNATCQISKNSTSKNHTLKTRLLVAADGGNSSVRKLMDIKTVQHDYHQSAITANITTSLPHNNVAYERFTSQGPVAMLPMQDRRCSLVWTWPTDKVQEIMQLPEEQFLSQLQSVFGNRLGSLSHLGKRHCYPLKLIKAKTQVKKRLALIGNAAHTLHPIAGQGFNLGMRDVATLAQIIVDQHKRGADIGLLGALQPYQQWRQQDHRRIIGFTDNLVKVFSNRFAPLALARNIGLVATDVTPSLKHLLAKHTMGMAGKLPRLVRGLQL